MITNQLSFEKEDKEENNSSDDNKTQAPSEKEEDNETNKKIIDGEHDDNREKKLSIASNNDYSIEKLVNEFKTFKLISEERYKEQAQEIHLLNNKVIVDQQEIKLLKKKVDELSSSLMHVQLRDYVKSLVKFLYKTIFKYNNDTQKSKNIIQDEKFIVQVDKIIEFITKYCNSLNLNDEKKNIFNGLIQFLNNIRESKLIGDETAHPNHISKIILPKSVIEKLSIEKSAFSKNELIIAIFNQNAHIQDRLYNFIQNIEILSFGRFGKKNLKEIINEFFYDN